MGLGSLVTGLAIYKPVQLGWLCAISGGYEFARILHFSLTLGYVLFFLVHIIQVILAGWNNFRAMVTGFEVIKEAPAPITAAETPAPVTDKPIPPILNEPNHEESNQK